MGHEHILVCDAEGCESFVSASCPAPGDRGITGLARAAASRGWVTVVRPRQTVAADALIFYCTAFCALNLQRELTGASARHPVRIQPADSLLRIRSRMDGKPIEDVRTELV